MYCQNCQKGNNQTNKYCSYCGTKPNKYYNFLTKSPLIINILILIIDII